MHIIGRPGEITAVAISGGPDSMAALSFLRNGGHKVVALHFNHGTDHAKHADKFVSEYCRSMNIPMCSMAISSTHKPKEFSWEEYWRIERYKFFKLHSDKVIATAHHLNDVAETYLMGAAHGVPKIIPYKFNHIRRPFLLVPRAALLRWCERNRVPFILDPSNDELTHMRNRVRHCILPEVLAVNPGFLTVISKKVLAEVSNETTKEMADNYLLCERT